jgi:hypothetical protein
MGYWVERKPEQGETVRFTDIDHKIIGVFLRIGHGSAQNFYIIDIGHRLYWAWELTTFEVWEK